MKSSRAIPFTLVTLVSFALAQTVNAQLKLATLIGSPNQEFGSEIEDVGDVDGDGTRDFAVGGPMSLAGSTGTGEVVVYDGANLQPIYTWFGATPGDRFGWSIAGLGDLDGDGHGEVLVGAPGSSLCGSNVSGGAGYAAVFDGATGAVRYSYAGVPAQRCGYAVAGGGNADGDGIGDFVIGFPGAYGSDGFARVYSGATGVLIVELEDPGFGSWYGSSLTWVPDSDLNGSDEVLVGAPGPGSWDDWEGEIDRYDSLTGDVLDDAYGSGTNAEYGWTTKLLDDVNGDGVRDVYVASRENGPLSLYDGRGSFSVLNGLNLSTIYKRLGSADHAAFGLDVALLSDLDGDGVRDFAVSSPGDSWCTNVQSSIFVYSAASGSVLFTIPESPNVPGDRFGLVLATIDVGGDRLDELVVGIPGADGAGSNAGRIEIYSVVRAPLVYCQAEVNSLGCTPSIGWSGTASATSSAAFDVHATNVINQKAGVCFYGLSPQSVPFQGGHLCAKAPLTRTPLQNSGGSAAGSDCSGQFHFDFNPHIQSGADPDLVAGVQVYAQFWSRDPFDPSGTNTSDALAFYVNP